MSDHKWDRFKRAFGASPSDDLVTVRDDKVKAALALVTAEIQRLTTAGLDAADLTAARDKINDARVKALRLRNNRDKCTVLDATKASARALVETTKPQVDQRLGAVASDQAARDALGLVTAAIRRLTTAGLDAGGLTASYDRVEDSRTQALRLTNDKAKYTALDEARTNARALADTAGQQADQRLGELQQQLQAVRKAIKNQIDNADTFRHPACQAAIADLRRAVDDAAKLAETRPTDEARRAALAEIDLQPLKDGLKRVTPARSAMGQLGIQLGGIAHKLTIIPDDHDLKGGFSREHKVLADEQAALANLRDLSELQRRADAALRNAKELAGRVQPIADAIELTGMQLQIARNKVAGAVADARAVQYEAGKSMVKNALAAVERASSEAEKKPTDQEKLDALNAIDLNPLRAAIRQSQDLSAGVPRLLTGLATIIGKLPEGAAKTELMDELVQLNGAADDLNKVVRPGVVAKGFAALKDRAAALMDRVAQAGGEAGYQEALGARFGVTVSVKDTAKVHLQKTYQMLAQVPESHVGHEKMKEVYFDNNPDGGGSYGSSKITIENINADKVETYVIDGKKVKANSFNVTMLHEIGHSVDDKYKIMEGLMGKPAYGDWQVEDAEKTATAITAAALADMKNPPDPLNGQVGTLVRAALSGNSPVRPDGANRAQWKALQKYCGIADAIRTANKPWFNAAPADVKVGERVYIQSYDKSWNSYKLSERNKTFVTNYQWRAPGEWFAEIYGISWLAKKKPSGLANDITQWLPE